MQISIRPTLDKAVAAPAKRRRKVRWGARRRPSYYGYWEANGSQPRLPQPRSWASPICSPRATGLLTNLRTRLPAIRLPCIACFALWVASAFSPKPTGAHSP